MPMPVRDVPDTPNPLALVPATPAPDFVLVPLTHAAVVVHEIALCAAAIAAAAAAG